MRKSSTRGQHKRASYARRWKSGKTRKGFNVEAVYPKCQTTIMEMIVQYDAKGKKNLGLRRKEMLNADT